MDSPRDADRPAVIDDDSGGGARTDRDLREVDSALGKALAKEKLKRYDAVEGFRNDLEAVRGGD